MAALVLRELSSARHYLLNGVRSACRQHTSCKSASVTHVLSRDDCSVPRRGRTFCTSKCREINRSSRLSRNQEEADASTSKSDEDYDKEVSDRILQAALPFVAEHGWSNTAISQGAETLGYAGVVHGMFPRGGFDLVHYFYLSCNEQLVEYLKQKESGRDGEKKIPEEILEDAVRTRLQMVIPYLSRWPEAMALMTSPPNVTASLAALLTMVDDICYFAGDRSVDLCWYGRRVGLASVYKATELYIVQDKSLDHKDTWRFLNQRLQEGAKIESVLEKSGDLSNLAKETFSATFATARNILRLNR